jgi:hypothetical protein
MGASLLQKPTEPAKLPVQFSCTRVSLGLACKFRFRRRAGQSCDVLAAPADGTYRLIVNTLDIRLPRELIEWQAQAGGLSRPEALGDPGFQLDPSVTRLDRSRDQHGRDAPATEVLGDPVPIQFGSELLDVKRQRAVRLVDRVGAETGDVPRLCSLTMGGIFQCRHFKITVLYRICGQPAGPPTAAPGSSRLVLAAP